PLLLLAALMWPLDVAVRRITLSPRQLVANAIGLVTERRAGDLEVAVPAELSRLRERVASTRRRRPAANAPPPLVGDGTDRPAPAAAKGKAAAEPEARPAERRREEEALSARLLEARRKRRGQGD
ncbi:MAG TPA: hypothetical protein VOB72_23800, partial [Candidatus Dormibacteraeota bacterium]|nr:hypothetical protein [Candidatus Dormibacteraeota bacterium]